jgi:hypothetical protein
VHPAPAERAPAARAGSAKTAELSRPPEATAAPEPMRVPAAARNIKLEVATGERRVEVRMMERGGDVHLAVRTPDQRLSGALRDNLPELSARLEQTGLRAEAWHTPGNSPRDFEPSVVAEPNPQSQPDGRRRQGDPEPRQPEDFQDQRNRKQKGQEFEWFMASLRG